MASIVNPGCIVPGVAGMTWSRMLTLDASCLVLQGDMASIVNPGCIVSVLPRIEKGHGAA